MSTKKRKPIKFEVGSGNIFADLRLKDANQLLAVRLAFTSSRFSKIKS